MNRRKTNRSLIIYPPVYMGETHEDRVTPLKWPKPHYVQYHLPLKTKYFLWGGGPVLGIIKKSTVNNGWGVMQI